MIEAELLMKVPDYDIVVLMESSHPPTKPSGGLLAETPAHILLKALTDFNFNSKLKRRPVFLDGGFENWKLYYPMHVSTKPLHDPSILERTRTALRTNTKF
jgi:hypothetical protein